MKVWLIHNNIPPYRVPLFAEIARRADFDFHVVLTALKCKHRLYWGRADGVLPFSVLVMKGLNIAVSDDMSVTISFTLLPTLIWRRPDVVICSGFGISSLVVFLYSRLCGAKYVVWSEATAVTEKCHRVSGLRKVLRILVARHASGFIDAGTLAREYIQSLLPPYSKTPFFRSYNCVDASAFVSGAMDAIELRELGTACDELLFVGRLSERKGIPMLLEVYKDVLGRCSRPVGLTLVGDGPLRPLVERFMHDVPCARIKLLGQVHPSQVAHYYRDCSAFVLLSLWDCNPLVVFEALHSGAPMVCSKQAGNACDFIVPGRNGQVVDPTNKAEIVTAVLDVLSWDAARRAACRRISCEQVAKANYEDAAAAFIESCHAVL